MERCWCLKCMQNAWRAMRREFATIIGKTGPITFQVVGHAKTCLVLVGGFARARRALAVRRPGEGAPLPRRGGSSGTPGAAPSMPLVSRASSRSAGSLIQSIAAEPCRSA